MTRTCRQIPPTWHRRKAWEVLRHTQVVTDPKKLAHLKAEAEKARLAGSAAPSPVYRK